MTSVDGQLVEVLRHLSEGDTATARELARGAGASGDPLPVAVAGALEGTDGRSVYEDPSAFQQFIDGGGNTVLYAEVGRRLRRLAAERRPRSLLDVGCGDGRVTAELVAEVRPDRVDLCEPSPALLDQARRRLEHGAGVVRAHAMGLEELVDAVDGTWDLAVATFSLHAVAPDARQRALAALCPRVRTLAIVEFDVPSFADRSPDHARYVVERYRRGIAEYEDRPEVVSGFLVPVMLRQFSDEERHTYEQPVDSWIDALRRAGFSDVRREPVADYWWAPAAIVVADGARVG